MELFSLLNVLAIVVSWILILFQFPRIDKRTFAFIVFIIVTVCAFLSVSRALVLLNLGTLMCSLAIIGSKKGIGLGQRNEGAPLNIIGGLLLAILFSTPIFIQDGAGWLIVLSAALKYWFLFIAAKLYSEQSQDNKRKILILSVTLVAGFIWQFKVAIAFSAIVGTHYCIKNGIIKGVFYIGIVLCLLVSLAYFLYLDEISKFFDNSVFRRNYDQDTKVFGFSDGARLMIWEHYWENSVWFGLGDYRLPFLVPPHNIVVHIAHELGILGVMVFGPVFWFLLSRIYYRMGIATVVMLILALGLSSVGEYAAMWVPCILIAPLALAAPLFRTKLTFSRRGAIN